MSEKETLVDLHGYCGFDEMLTYRLDQDIALVFVSAWSSLGTDRPVATIEHMQKVREAEKE